MVTTRGNASGYVAGAGHDEPPSLPRPPAVRPAHRPWCCDCKRTLDADQLDTDGRCETCARAAANRARRAAEQPAEPPRPPRRAPRTARPAPADDVDLDDVDVEDEADVDLPPASSDDTLIEVPVGSLTPDPDNPRHDLGDLTELAASMREVGLYQPVVARRRRRRLLVIAGHRRLAAARLLGWSTVPCIIRSAAADLTDTEVLLAMLAENTQRADLDPIDEANALAVLKADHSLTDVQLAAKVSRSQAWVSNRLALLDLTPAQQAKVRAGVMSLAASAPTNGDAS